MKDFLEPVFMLLSGLGWLAFLLVRYAPAHDCGSWLAARWRSAFSAWLRVYGVSRGVMREVRPIRRSRSPQRVG